MAQRFTVDTLEFQEDSGSLCYRPTRAKRIGHATVGILLGVFAISVGLWLVLNDPISKLTEMALDKPFGVFAVVTGLALLASVVFYLRDAKRGIQIDGSGEIVHGKPVMHVSSVHELETVFHRHPKGHTSWTVSLRGDDRLIDLPWLRFSHESEADRVRTEIAQFLG